MNTASLKQDYQERIVPILMKEFNYTTVMQCPKLQKIVLNQGLGEAVADKGRSPGDDRYRWSESSRYRFEERYR